jgi:xanthine dehydrogenase YagR molybdenum-binding subunit
VRLIKVTTRERPFVVGLEAAMADGAPQVYSEAEMPGTPERPRKGNVMGPEGGARESGRGDIEKGFAEAEVVHEATYSLPVHTHCPLETHSVVAAWEGEQLKVYASTQGILAVREGLAEALSIDRKNVRVICEHMGGGFGSKLHPSAVGSAFAVVACRLAKQAGAPVRMVLDRRQQQLCTGNAPSARMTIRLGAKKDGTLTAIHHRSYGSPGIAGGAGTGGPARSLHQKTPHVRTEDYSVFTNAGPEAPLRAPGHPQGAFSIESAIDELAEKLGMDPIELRKKNEGSPVRLAQYDVGARAIGWERRNRKAGEGSGPKKRGIGMASGVWYVIAAHEGIAAEIQVHRDGGIELYSGAQDLGTGFRTAITLVAAEELGVEPEDVTPRIGDTRFPQGLSSGGSMTTNSIAPAVRLAAADARERLFAIAAPLLGVAATALSARAGRIFVTADPSRGLEWRKVATKMPGEQIVCRADRKPQYETYRWDLAGCQFCEVEVDVETGVVRVVKMVSVNDCGMPVNPLTAESQVIGAMIQGASWALLEERILDANVGTMVNPNLESYKILTPADMFEAVSILTPVANGGNNTSIAGIGEPPLIPTLAAVANAVYNATGARIRNLPLTPDRVLAALSATGRRG